MVDLTDVREVPVTKTSQYLTPHTSKKSGHRVAHDCENQKGSWEKEVARILVDNTGCRYTKGHSRVLIPKIVLNHYYPEEEEIEMTAFQKACVE